VLLVLASAGGIATVIGLVRGIRQRGPRSRGLDEAPKGFLIDLLLPPGRAEDALVNILGRYDYWVAKHGIRKAHAIFMTQSIVVVVTYWIDLVLRRLKLFSLFRRS
jgi:hypothetical protein